MPNEDKNTKNESPKRKGLSRRDFLKSSAVAGGSLLASRAFHMPAVIHAQTPELVVWLERQLLPTSEAYMEESVMQAAEEGGFKVRVDFANPGDDAQNRLLAGLEAGALPDITHTLSLALLNSAGTAMDVTDLFQEIGESGGGWIDGAAQKATVGDKVIAIPNNVEPWYLHYRKSIFEAAGFTPPFETMEEYREALIAVTNPRETIWGFGGQMNRMDAEGNFIGMIHAFGGQLWDEEGNIVINSPETLEALKFYTDMLVRYEVMPPGVAGWDPAGNNASYLAGQVATTMNTGSILQAMRQDDQEMLEDTIVAPWPAGWTDKGRKSSILRAFGLVINKETRYPEEAKHIVKTIMSPERYPENLVQAGGFWFSSLKAYADLPFFLDDPWNKMATEKVIPFCRAGEFAYGPNPTYNEIGQDALGVPLQRVAVDGVDPQEALDEFEELVREIQEKNQAAQQQ